MHQTNLKSNKFVNLFILLAAVGILNSQTSFVNAEELRAQPSSIVFNATEGHPVNYTRSIFLTTTNGGVITWSLTTSDSWMSADLSEGSTDGIARISANPYGLSPGTYNGNIIFDSPESTTGPVIIAVSLIVNPDVPVTITPWKDGLDAAMSVSVDDSKGSGFDALQANGFKGTYVLENIYPPSYYTDYYNAGMELGCHTVSHNCFAVSDSVLRYQEILPNISALCTKTPEPCKDVITLVWPCGFTNYREEAVASDYFLSARGYNFNLLEDIYPENMMNLKNFNSHEHYPYPPSDLKTVVDQAVSQKKWFNLVLHDYSNDDGATTYASTKSIWVTAIGTVVKYILQRDRFILTDYNLSYNKITYKVSRSSIPASPVRPFENAFGTNDVVTMQVDIDDSKTVENVFINGAATPFQIKNINGNQFLLANVRLDPSTAKEVEIKYVFTAIGLTVTGVTAEDKVYNSSTSAVINTTAAALSGVLPGDDVTLVTTGAAGAFSNKNIGTGKTVITSGFTITGADIEKYALLQPSTTASITKANLSVSGLTANNKVYNGTTSATLNTGSASLTGIIPGDVVTLVTTGAIGSFDNKNVGTGKTVTVTSITLGGTDGGNYDLALPPPLTANITRAPLTIKGVTADNKLYDGTTTAVINTGSASLNGIISGDVVTLNSAGATGTFDNEFSGTGKTVTTSGFTISGTDSGNYTVTQPTATADIIGLPLTITGVTANNKVYNGSATATLNTGSAALSGVHSGDAVSLVKTGATGAFNNENAGTSKTVTTSGFTITGTDARKYSLTQPVTSADITKAALTVTGVTVNDKVYNATTSATLNTGSAALVGIVPGDNVTLISTGATGAFSGSSVGTSKAVTITGFAIGGSDSGNYSLTQPPATGNITPLPLTVTGVTANNKVYNGSTSATLNTGSATLSGVLPGDVVTLVTTGATGTFSNKNAGPGKTVLTSGFTLGGADAANYSITQPVITAGITAASLTLSGVTANNRVYNGTTDATLNSAGASLAGVISGDAVTIVTAGASGAFSDKNIGTSKSVSITGYALGGTDAGNYSLVQPSASASITTATLTVTGVSANNKTYDGTDAATLNTASATLVGRFGSDVVTISSNGNSGRFSDKNAGTHKAVSIPGFSIAGADSYNYTIVQPSVFADITVRTLTLTANDLIKDYKTTLTFKGTEYTATGLIPGDNPPAVVLTSPGAQESAMPGLYVINITAGPFNNYSITCVNGELTVGKRQITATADNKSKIYGSDNPPLTITYTGFLAGDNASGLEVLPVASTNALRTSNAGRYTITLSGGSDTKYSIKLVNGSLDIAKAPLEATADNITRTYGNSNPELTISYSGFMPGQDQAVLDQLPVAETEATESSDAGDYEINISGASDNNYSFTYNKGTLTVNKADQLISFEEFPSELRMTREVELKATSSSGLPVSFRFSDPGKASLNGNIMTLVADGRLTVDAVQEGDHNWNAAPEVARTIDILPTFDNISSLFTPNADGMNDYWYIPDLDQYGQVKVTVYNRFGQVVYKSDGYKNDWDGTWNGHPLPSASYYYIINSSKLGFIKGVVNIVR
jgi:gliding motility-associated-like protein